MVKLPEVLSLRLSHDDWAALRQLASADDRTVSQFVRRRLRELVAEQLGPSVKGTGRDAVSRTGA